jgi:non-specific serine/threonine protein kinase
MPLARAALAIAEAIDDQEIVAHAIHLLGLIAEAQQSWEEAESLFVHALARWRALDAWVEEAVALLHLSNVVFSRGDRDLATQHAEAALARFRASGYAAGAGMALGRRARLARDRGDSHEAALAYHEALRLWSSQNDHWYIRMALTGLAELASAYGQSSAAASLLGSVDTLVQEAGALLSPAGFEYVRATTAARAALGAERFAELHAKGQHLSLAEAVAIAATISVPVSATDRVLTAREIEVLRLIAAGRTDRQIADALFVSSRTINAHVAHILTKLEVHTRRDAVIRGRELDLLTGDARPERYT